ncbi:hypothetical protein PV328_002659 [Microctonus aethiopoides]|uniref:Riboflavin transporter n=1 Tax=Microctonus aethiopoides TaxID=144406 RepID=A0AA39F6X7_9HYME|nr:hypothetical protein PV328_002659 [Microctonus aethiopoides]
MCNMITRRLSNRKLLVDVLAIMFGIATWIGINGIYVQLPLLINSAPEKWNLPVHMVMLVQIANLGPILYTIYAKYFSWTRDTYIIYGLLGCATIAIYLMAISYKYTSYIFGAEHSTALLALMFLTAVVGCTSSVLFTPYMRNYREIYLVSYLVGEGLSGFIPSAVTLIQGVGGNPRCKNITKPGDTTIKWEPFPPEPRFSTETFFLFLGTLLLMGFISFIGLNKLPVARGERVKPPGCTETLPTDINAPPSYKTNAGWAMTRQMYLYLLTMIGIIGFLGHSALPSIQPFSCMPYGNVAYHVTLTLGAMATPLTMCLGFIQKTPKSVNFLSLLTGFIVLLSGVVLYLALQSPTPPFRGTWYGVLFVVCLWILLNGLIGFVKMGITTIFRPDPGRGLYYAGVSTQVGSLVGAIMTFILLKQPGLFNEYTCDDLMGKY